MRVKSHYLQDSKGRMRGSVSLASLAGKTRIPTAQDTPGLPAAPAASSPPPVDYDEMHAQFAALGQGHEAILRARAATQKAVASSPQTPPGLLHALASDERSHPELLVEIAKNPAATPETLRVLSGSRDVGVRCWAAWSERLPTSELPRLARDRDVNVRQGACQHPDAPPEVLLHAGSLATEPDRFVRQSARDHRNYPAKAERLAMASDPNADSDALLVLAGDGLPQVARAARTQLEARGIDVPDFRSDDD